MVEEGLKVRFEGDASGLESAAKRAVTASQNFGKAHEKMGMAAYQARYAVIDLSHTVRDLPYAMSNPAILAGPFDRMFQAIVAVKQETGSLKGALGVLGSQLSGGAGIMIAFNLVTTAATLFAQRMSDAGGESEKASKEIKKASDAIGQSGTEFTKAYTAINTLRENIDLAKKGFIDKKEVVSQYNKELGDAIGKVKSLDEVERKIATTGEAYIRFTLLKAAAQKALEKASDEALKAAELQATKTLEPKKGVKPLFQTITKPDGDAEHPFGVDWSIVYSGVNKQIFKAKKEEKRLTDVFKDLQDEASKIAKDFGIKFNEGKFDDKTKTNKPEFNFFDKFFSFNPDGKLSEKQRSELLDAARSFQKEFGKALQGLDFYKTTEDASLNSAREFWRNFQKGIIKLKPNQFRDIDLKVDVPVVPDTSNDSKHLIAEYLDTLNQDAARQSKGYFSGGWINDLEVNRNLILDKYKQLFKQIGQQMPKTIEGVGGVNKKVADVTDTKELEKGLSGSLTSKKQELEGLAKTVSGVVAPAFSNLFEAIEAGKPPLQAFFSSITDSINQLIKKLIEAAVEAAIFSVILPGSGGFGKQFGKMLGFGSAAGGGINIATPFNGGGGGGFAAMSGGGINVNVNGIVRGGNIILATARTNASQRRTG